MGKGQAQTSTLSAASYPPLQSARTGRHFLVVSEKSKPRPPVQLGIDPRQSRQGLRIQAIVFLAALPDQPHMARIRHDHFVSTQLGKRQRSFIKAPISSLYGAKE
jgi:hypothetical protein